MDIDTTINFDADEIVQEASESIVTIIREAEFARVADVEQAVENAIADCPFIDRDDAIEIAHIAAREEGVSEDRVETIVDHAIENHTWDLDDAEAERWARNALLSIPSDPGGRCALGRAFTDAVLTVVEDIIGQRSERGTAMFGELAMNLACYALVEGGGSAEPAPEEVVPERKFGLRLINEVGPQGDPLVIGPFDTWNEAQDWAVRTNRHGSHITIEVPVAVTA